MNKKQLTVGVYDFTSCAGCQMELINLEKEWLDLTRLIDFTHFRLIGRTAEDAVFDVALVEGAISTPDEAKRVKEIREKAEFVVSFGTCGSFGGVPSIKDFFKKDDIEREVYGNSSHLDSIKAEPVSAYIKVDYVMRGCPIDKTELVRVFKDLLAGKTPREPQGTVCRECKEKGNRCLFKERPCMGAITNAGCGALCPSNGWPCLACRGPTDDSNIESALELLKEHKVPKDQIQQMFRFFAGRAKQFEDRRSKMCQDLI
ncbi:MAG: hypothetical protein V1834_02590 [Candidatus Micrarchaeota archaeon]